MCNDYTYVFLYKYICLLELRHKLYILLWEYYTKLFRKTQLQTIKIKKNKEKNNIDKIKNSSIESVKSNNVKAQYH